MDRYSDYIFLTPFSISNDLRDLSTGSFEVVFMPLQINDDGTFTIFSFERKLFKRSHFLIVFKKPKSILHNLRVTTNNTPSFLNKRYQYIMKQKIQDHTWSKNLFLTFWNDDSAVTVLKKQKKKKDLEIKMIPDLYCVENRLHHP